MSLKKLLLRGSFAVALSMLGVWGVASSGSAAPALNVSFAAGGSGASAGWSAGVGSPIDLTLGSPSSTTYALITLHHVAGASLSTLVEPTFTTSAYNAGSPRWYITLSNGASLWGYPPQFGDTGDFSWAVNNGNSYVSWSDAVNSEGDATVTGAWVIADGDQSAGTTNVITGLEFAGHLYN